MNLQYRDGVPLYYDLLSLPRSAPSATIKERVRALLMEWHPDRCQRPDATGTTKDILEAKNVLLDAVRRQSYDEALAKSLNPAQGPSSAHGSPWEEQRANAARDAARDSALSLDQLLSQLGIALLRGEAAVQSGEFVVPAWRLVLSGIAGWSLILALFTAGISMVSFMLFGWAFFIQDSKTNEMRFIGIQHVLTGMLLAVPVILAGAFLLCAGLAKS